MLVIQARANITYTALQRHSGPEGLAQTLPPSLFATVTLLAQWA